MLCWFCIVQNFWQATKASLLWGVAPVQVVSHLCHCICALTAICAVASCNGTNGCHYASLHSGFVWLTASILAWSRGGSPSNISPARMPGVYAARLCRTQSQPNIHSPSPRGRGLGFRQGRRDRTPKGFARTQSQQSVLKGIENLLYIYKNRLFLQPEMRQAVCLPHFRLCFFFFMKETKKYLQFTLVFDIMLMYYAKGCVARCKSNIKKRNGDFQCQQI